MRPELKVLTPGLYQQCHQIYLIQTSIFPFQEEADIMFNSSLVYELGVLKKMSENILGEIDSSYPEYSEAKRLTEFLGYFLPISHKEIPLNSILREFIGGSCFYNTIS